MTEPSTNEDILKVLADMRADICMHLHDHDRTLTTITDQVAALTEAKRSNSLRAKDLSESDLAQAAMLASEIEARKMLAITVDRLHSSNETQLAILQRLDRVASNPQVKVLLTVMATVALGWLASRGVVIK